MIRWFEGSEDGVNHAECVHIDFMFIDAWCKGVTHMTFIVVAFVIAYCKLNIWVSGKYCTSSCHTAIYAMGLGMDVIKYIPPSVSWVKSSTLYCKWSN